MPSEDPPANPPAEKTFTQADLDRLIDERLKRERSKFADYDDLKTKADKLAELEAQGKTETQKLTDKLAETERRAAAAEARAMRMEVAAEKGLTASQAKRLVGESREDLEADADDLLKTFKPSGANGDGAADGAGDGTGGTKPPGRPTEKLRGGGDPTEEPPVDIRKVVEGIPRGF